MYTKAMLKYLAYIIVGIVLLILAVMALSVPVILVIGLLGLGTGGQQITAFVVVGIGVFSWALWYINKLDKEQENGI